MSTLGNQFHKGGTDQETHISFLCLPLFLSSVLVNWLIGGGTFILSIRILRCLWRRMYLGQRTKRVKSRFGGILPIPHVFGRFSNKETAFSFFFPFSPFCCCCCCGCFEGWIFFCVKDFLLEEVRCEWNGWCSNLIHCQWKIDLACVVIWKYINLDAF